RRPSGVRNVSGCSAAACAYRDGGHDQQQHGDRARLEHDHNPLAAVPSLHVGFAFAVGIALAAATQSCWSQLLWLGWGPLVTLTVVARGTHFIFDVIAGLCATAIGYGVGAGAAWTAHRISAAARRGSFKPERPLAPRDSALQPSGHAGAPAAYAR